MQHPLTEMGEQTLAHLRAAVRGRAGRHAGIATLMIASALVSGGTVAMLRPGVSTASPGPTAASSASTGAHHRPDRAPRSSSDRPVVRHVTTSPAIQTTAPPVRVTIPVMNINQRLVGLRVDHGELQVPQDYGDIGWWSDGPAPGEQGAAVLVGHVDSRTGPAVFYGLSGIQPGARIVVHRADGSTATFQVRRTDVYSRGDFPSQRVYTQTGKPQLHLLTCGGSYNRAVGQYDSNVVVSADLMSVHRPQPPKARVHRSGRHPRPLHQHQGNHNRRPRARP